MTHYKPKNVFPNNAISIVVPYTLQECLAILSDFAADQYSQSTRVTFKHERDSLDSYHARFSFEQVVQIESRAFRRLRLTGVMVYDVPAQMTRILIKAQLPSHEESRVAIILAVLGVLFAVILCAYGQLSFSTLLMGIVLVLGFGAWQWWEYDFTVVKDPRRFDLVTQIENVLHWGHTDDS
ncbi:MAG: hypothetical protein RLP44_19540 [Aggregatilineales bacterium]